MTSRFTRVIKCDGCHTVEGHGRNVIAAGPRHACRGLKSPGRASLSTAVPSADGPGRTGGCPRPRGRPRLADHAALPSAGLLSGVAPVSASISDGATVRPLACDSAVRRRASSHAARTRWHTRNSSPAPCESSPARHHPWSSVRGHFLRVRCKAGTTRPGPAPL